MHKTISFLLGLFCLVTFSALADVRLPSLFSDNMVLQRGTTVHIWGWADDGEKVTVTFRNQTKSTTAKNGKWEIKLSSMKAGGPDTLTVTGKNSIRIGNVLVGEVWLCSGQSNMEFALRNSFEVKDDIDHSGNSMLRLFNVPNVKADEPTTDVKANWQVGDPESTPGFSAVAYYFGRALQKHLGVPVGLIQSDWGGSPAEVWMSHSALAKNQRYQSEILDQYTVSEKNYEKAMEDFKTAKTDKSKNAPRAPWKPTELYNGMIAPLTNFTIKGAIWYQGESNSGRAEQYRSLFADMIRNWRADWNEGNFPFLLVQLAPFMPIKKEPGDSSWAELRDAQLNATKMLPNVGMAVITDVGEEHNIHPTKKQPVGERLALEARKIAYGEKITASGPTFKKMKVKGDKAILSFDDVDGGLIARDGELKGFAIAGADKKFVWADAKIDGKKIVVSSPEVKNPVAVRFGWADYPVVNLWNKEGLPATPFRTDDFPMITAGKK